MLSNSIGGQGAPRSEVSTRAAAAGFELEAIAHAARVIFEDLTRGKVPKGSSTGGILHDRRSPSAGACVFALRNVLVPLRAVREDSQYVTQVQRCLRGRHAPRLACQSLPGTAWNAG